MKIANNLTLPQDAITQTHGFIGRKGSGKTYASTRQCELFLKAGIQCIALDPVGNWYGLRLDKSGKGPSQFNIPIIGGEHGDIPLDHKSGEVVANFLLESGSSAIIDVSHFRKGQRKEFVAMFAEQLFHAQKKRRIPLHLFIEEAQVFIPQRAGKGEERMLGAMEDIVRLGRNYGIGVSLNTQRPQSVNKEVLNQVEPLIVFQLVGSHERKAIQEWVSYSGANVKEQLDTLPSLKSGDGFFWSPAWLNKFQKIRYTEKETFDASATPTMKNGSFQHGKLSELTISDLGEQMSAMVEKAKESSPAALMREVQRLQRELNKAARGIPEHEVNKRIAAAVAEAKKSANSPSPLSDECFAAMRTIHGIAAQFLPETKSTIKPTTTGLKTYVSKPAAGPVNSEITGPMQRILDALVWWESTGIGSPYSRIQVSFIAGYKPGSGAFNNPLSSLRSSGLIDYPAGGMVALTDKGRDIANPVQSPATQSELHQAIMSRLNGPQRKILQPLIDAYPSQLSRDEVAEISGYTPGSGAFNNPVSSMKSLGLIEYPVSGYIKAAPDLFI